MNGKDTVTKKYAYGVDMLNLKKGMRSGLIYEESVKNYLCWFQGMLEHFLLNLPYFSATFSCTNEPWEYEFRRRVKTVERGRCIFKAKVTLHFTSLSIPLDSVRIRTSKEYQTLDERSAEEEFSLLVSLPKTEQHQGVFGLISASLVWTKEGDERITVDSPIILLAENVPAQHIMRGVYRSYDMYA